MEIDHFNPTLQGLARNEYSNLMLATRHCNSSKSDTWPTLRQQANGMRFLNPCVETDFGVHIFEDPDTFLLWGATAEGRFQIRMLDLNANHLVQERRARHTLRALWNRQGRVEYVGTFAEGAAEIADGLKELRRQTNLMIPPLPQRPDPKHVAFDSQVESRRTGR
jgi:hypothetical protein